MSALRIARDLTFPLEAVTQTFAIVGMRGSGKTSTSVVIVEELVKARLPVVVIDPTGVWWGLRYGADGKGPGGLPVLVIGGEHGDIPLTETAGGVLAEFVVTSGQPCVIDLSPLSKNGARRFMVEFSERLYHFKAKHKEPLHVVLDESDLFIPQRTNEGTERLVGAINDLVRRGRVRGIGVTLISQRPALINKDVLTQVETMIALRLTGPQDSDALKRWVETYADPSEGAEMLKALPGLAQGVAYVWSPGWLKVFQKSAIRERESFDSSKTPRPGEKVRAPKNPAEIDLSALQARMAETIETVKASDPRELRRQIAELRAELDKRGDDRLTNAVHVAKAAIADEKLLRAAARERAEWLEIMARVRERATSLVDAAYEASVNLEREVRRYREEARDQLNKAIDAGLTTATSDENMQHLYEAWSDKPATLPPTPVDSFTTSAAYAAMKTQAYAPTAKLALAERKILTALAQHSPKALSKGRVAALAGYSASGGGFNNPLSRCRVAKYVVTTSVGELRITELGLEALGPYESLPTGEALHAYWLGQLGKAPRLILQTLIEFYPAALPKQRIVDYILDRDGVTYAPNGGGFNNPISELCTKGLAVRVSGNLQASPDLFET